MSALTVRPGTEDALPFLLRGESACFPDPWGEGGIRGQLTAGVGLSLICFSDGEPAGYLFAAVMPPEGEILRIATLPRFRRRGVGRALLAELFRRADDAGVDCLFLDVRESNALARALYNACGFRESGRRSAYYRAPREDAILMERKKDEHHAVSGL